MLRTFAERKSPIRSITESAFGVNINPDGADGGGRVVNAFTAETRRTRTRKEDAQGASPFHVQALLGHTTLEMTRWYCRGARIRTWRRDKDGTGWWIGCERLGVAERSAADTVPQEPGQSLPKRLGDTQDIRPE